MITVQFMKPFYTKVSGSKLRLVFAYQYFSIIKDDEVFHFIPIEGKDMEINLETMQVENLSEVFVFQRGNRFIRLPLYQLMLVSNVQDYLKPILDEVDHQPNAPEPVEEVDAEVEEMVGQLELNSLLAAIDDALDDRNEALFQELTNKLNKLNAEGGFLV